MKEPRDRTPFLIGARLAALRKEKGWNQKDFAEQFAEFCGSAQEYGISVVSAWEQNHRAPTMRNIVSLAQFYGVSIDFLFGLTDQRRSEGSLEKRHYAKELADHAELPISDPDLVKYNGQPVFVKFRNASHINQWGILDTNNGRVVCKDFIVSLSVYVELYPYTAPAPVRTKFLNFQQLMNADYIWIEMITKDPVVSEHYNGRYQHSEDKKFLVKMENGITLPYTGFDVSFNAFRG